MRKRGPAPAHIAAIHPLYTLKTDVIFSVRGESVRVRLDRRTAKRFLKRNTINAVGLLTWKRRRMVKWQPVRPAAHLPNIQQAAHGQTIRSHRSFLSYSTIASADARWVESVFQASGIIVWFAEHELEAGDSLPKHISTAITEADSLVPIVDQNYLDSQWCANELRIAVAGGIPVAPVKFSFDELSVPPELRSIYEQDLGDPLMLDLRRGDVEDRLQAFAQKLRGRSRS